MHAQRNRCVLVIKHANVYNIFKFLKDTENEDSCHLKLAKLARRMQI